jgi:hypothetical protein
MNLQGVLKRYLRHWVKMQLLDHRHHRLNPGLRIEFQIRDSKAMLEDKGQKKHYLQKQWLHH